MIQFDNASVLYGSTVVLSDINLRINKKEYIGVIGPNGGGKTTLIKMMLGLVKPSKGKVNVLPNVEFGYVPQFNSFEKNFPITVEEVVLLGTLSKKIKFFKRFSNEEINKTEYFLKKLKINQLKNRNISTLSGGQLQKVLLARALNTNPNVIVLDEPTASIDKKSKEEIYNFLDELKKEKTIIIVSHEVLEIIQRVDKIVCVNKNVHYHGDKRSTPREIIEEIIGK